MIQERIRQGVYVKDVVAELGVHPRTVSRALQRGSSPPGERPAARKSKLDRYKPVIDRLLAAGVWNAAVILREIEEQGYTGQASILRDYIRPKRPLRQARATVRFETAPGEQLQNDWAKYRTLLAGREQEVHFAVNTLGYSRRFHFVAMACEDAEHTYESLIQSFEYFGGVTGEVLVDNQKAEVISHRIGAAVEYNPRFLELAAHYGFQPRACRPRRARTKGKDERMVRYIKENFFVRYREFESLTHLNQLAEQWLREEADQRLHGTVKEVVAEQRSEALRLWRMAGLSRKWVCGWSEASARRSRPRTLPSRSEMISSSSTAFPWLRGIEFRNEYRRAPHQVDEERALRNVHDARADFGVSLRSSPIWPYWPRPVPASDAPSERKF
jgi:transposase